MDHLNKMYKHKKPRSIKINCSFDTPIILRPGKDKLGYFLEMGAESKYGGKAITPCEVKRLIKYLERFVDWTEKT